MSEHQRRWLITETCEYVVRAETAEDAENLYLAHVSSAPDEGSPIELLGVVDRMVEEDRR